MSNYQNIDNGSEVLSNIGRNLYLNPDKADVHFIFESSDERIPAQKNILSGASDVFDTMFYGSLKEDGDIKIVDSTAGAFKEFLRFFYFNKVDVSMEHVSEVMYLGRKYNVAECHRLCANLLEANITDETVVSALSLAIFHEQEQLQKSCESFIASNSHKVLKSDSFIVCDRPVLEHILKMSRLECSETVLFEACMSWIRACSNQNHLTRDLVQTHLGNLFYKIRFGDMSLDEFAKLLPVYGELFSVNEYSEMLQVFSGQERNPKIFKASRHSPVWDSTKIVRCNRFLDYCGRMCRFQTEEVTKFSTNTALLLGFFSVAPIFDHETSQIDYIGDINATVVVANSKEILTQFKFDLPSRIDDDACKTDVPTQFDFLFNNDLQIQLPTPISIEPGIIYEIRIKFPTNEQRHTRLTLKSTVNMANRIVVHFHNDKIVNGKAVGAITLLGFNLPNSV